MSDVMYLIRRALTFLPDDPELCEPIDHFSKHSGNKALQILFLGMFNRGKSTVINALLQAHVVPTGLVPMTGSSIRVTYGETPVTHVLWKNGPTQSYEGVDELRRIAVLGNGVMRRDIEEVVVEFPHPLLQAGLELVDLPGANDKPEQDAFIYRRLFTADLIIHVLDACDQWTLSEDHLLKNWVLALGLRDMVFVVNRANLLDEDDRDKAMFAIRDSLTTEFDNASRPLELIYQLNALPALQAAKRNEPTERSVKMFSHDLMSWANRHCPKIHELRDKKLMRMVAMIHDTLRREIIENGVLLNGKEDALRALAALCEVLPEEGRTSCSPMMCTDVLKEHIRRLRRNPFGSKPYDASRSPW